MKKIIIIVIFSLGFQIHSAQTMERDTVIMIMGDNRQSIVMKVNVSQSLSNLRLELMHSNRMAKDDVFLSTQKIDVFQDDEAQWTIKDILNNNSISLIYRDSIRTPQFLEKEYLRISIEANEEEVNFWNTVWYYTKQGDIKVMPRYTPEALFPRIFPIKDPDCPWLNYDRESTSQNINLWDYKLFTRSEGSTYNAILSIRLEYNHLTGLNLPHIRVMQPNYFFSDQLKPEYKEIKWKL
jgi:hypothetical protein